MSLIGCLDIECLVYQFRRIATTVVGIRPDGVPVKECHKIWSNFERTGHVLWRPGPE